MKYKFSAIITFIAFFACVDHYDIESFSEIQYEPYSNLGFEDGLEHWHGQANTFSSISIDSDAFEGLNSLKISINSDSSSQTENFDQSLAEISKSLDVYQGDTILVSYQLRNSQNSYENIHFFNTSFFKDKDGFLVQSSIDTIQNISISWNTVNVRYPVPKNAVKLTFGVRIQGIHTDAHALLDDFSISTKALLNQVPSGFSLIAPSNGSSLTEGESVELTWGVSEDLDGDIITYDLEIWTEAVVENYLVNSGLDDVVTHWLGDEIPAEWDFWPYYYHNVFSYPQLGDSSYNQNYVYSGDHSMSITGDFTGQSNKTILYQGFSSDYMPPGTVVTFSGYMLNPSIDPMRNDNQAYISIDQFSNSGGGVNNASWIINHSSESITSNDPVDEWSYFEVSSTTEENTNYIQIRINFEQFNDDSGSVFIDDLSIRTNNNRLILHNHSEINSTNISVDKSIFTDPYDFRLRESLIYFWNIKASDGFSEKISENGPFELKLN
ncbi:MAG: hypothetical protein VW963_07900 [Candidatus Neomarinimicrobiota bacterium]